MFFNNRITKVEIASVIFSFLALLISSATLYFSYFYKKNEVQFQIVDYSYDTHDIITEVSIYNSGNTESVIKSMDIIVESHGVESDTDTHTSEKRSFTVDSNKYPIYLKPGDLRVLKIPFYYEKRKGIYKSIMKSNGDEEKFLLTIQLSVKTIGGDGGLYIKTLKPHLLHLYEEKLLLPVKEEYLVKHYLMDELTEDPEYRCVRRSIEILGDKLLEAIPKELYFSESFECSVRE